MNIRDVKTSTYRPDQLSGGTVGPTEPIRNDVATRGDDPAKRGDRVEISSKAREAAAAGAQERELNIARKALLGIPPLSNDRAADIHKRIQEGYYSQPEVLKVIAERATSELTGGL